MYKLCLPLTVNSTTLSRYYACTLCFLQFLVLFCSYILTFLPPFLGFYFCFLFCVSHLTYQVVSAPLVMELCVERHSLKPQKQLWLFESNFTNSPRRMLQYACATCFLSWLILETLVFHVRGWCHFDKSQESFLCWKPLQMIVQAGRPATSGNLRWKSNNSKHVEWVFP